MVYQKFFIFNCKTYLFKYYLKCNSWVLHVYKIAPIEEKVETLNPTSSPTSNPTPLSSRLH